MPELQQEVVRMISGLSDDNISFLIEIIHRLMPQSEKADTVVKSSVNENKGMRAFRRLDVAREEIRQYFPDDFDGNRNDGIQRF